MPTKLPIERLRKRIHNYVDGVLVMDISADAPTAIVKAPVEMGLAQFVDIHELPDLNDLPYISERKRDFAFRYATAYKPAAYWAKEYAVSKSTIDKWLGDKAVRAYIAVTRYEQRMFNFAQHTILQRNVYKAINDILAVKLTADTIGAVGQMARFMYNILHTPQDAASKTKAAFNVNIGFDRKPPEEEPTIYVNERNVTPQQIQKINEDIEELELLAEAFNVNGDDDE